IGAGALRLVDRFPDRAGLGAEDDVVGGLQQGPDAVADDLVVVNEHDPEGCGHPVMLSSSWRRPQPSGGKDHPQGRPLTPNGRQIQRRAELLRATLHIVETLARYLAVSR